MLIVLLVGGTQHMKKPIVLILPLLMTSFLSACDEVDRNILSSQELESSERTSSSSQVENKKTVKFDSNGGTHIEDQVVEYGKPASKPDDPTKQGFRFEKWTLNNEEYNFNNPVIEDITLVANYIMEEYSVVFKNTDGTVLDTQDNLHYGDTITYHGETPTRRPPAHNRIYVFAGWDKPLIVTGDMVITATYTERYETYDVRYVNYDMVVLHETITHDPDVIPAYPSLDPIRYKDDNYMYQFSHWRREDNENEITLFAQYEKCSLGVKFDKNIVSGYEGASDSVVLPNKWDGVIIDTIGENAFKDNATLKGVDAPETIDDVLRGAFENCTGLESIAFKEGLHFIETQAFKGCSSLANISIPNTMVAIGSNAFEGCTALQYAEYQNAKYLGNANNPYLGLMDIIDKSVDTFVMNDNCIFTAASVLYDLGALRNITVSNNIKHLGQSGFTKCTNLVTNTYNNAKYIGSATNPYLVLVKPVNTSITECEVHPNCKAIDDSAFSGCKSLKEINLPEGLSFIGVQAFANCSALEAIDIPGTVMSVNLATFSKCSKLETVTLHEGLRYIEPSGFSQCSALKAINIPDSVMYIGDSAFGTCSALQTVKLPKNLVKLLKYTFQSCMELKEVIIPERVNEIKEGAFSNCRKLETVHMPTSVKALGTRLFNGDPGIVTIIYAGKTTEFAAIEKDEFWDKGVGEIRVEYPNDPTFQLYPED